MARHKPKVIDTLLSPHQSDRTDAIRAIILHSTESHNRAGESDIRAVAGWFQNPTSQASSHVIVDGDGTSIRCVRDVRKAWTCARYNSQTLNVEQVGLASYGFKVWKKEYREELKETARWIARWSDKYGIPIRKGKASGGRITRTGVLKHKDLGVEGGNHTDPGPYPLVLVLKLAKRYKKKLNG